MNISIDLGNIWEMLSAIGTIGAVIVSLWLVRRDETKKLKVETYISFYTYGDKIDKEELISIELINMGKTTIKINEVGIFQKGKKTRLQFVDYLIGSDELPIYLDEEDDAKYLQHKRGITNAAESANYNLKKVVAYAKDSAGKMYYSKKFSIK